MNLLRMHGTMFLLDIVNIEKKSISVNWHYSGISTIVQALAKRADEGLQFPFRDKLFSHSVQEDS